MIRVQKLKSEYSPIQKIGEQLYRISWDYKPVMVSVINDNHEIQYTDEETDYATWMIEDFRQKPAIAHIKSFILDWYNKQIDSKILQGFTWKDMPIWLSTENQFNYKAAYDLAVQTEGATLPVTFKFGTTNNPVYYAFETVTDLTDFYIQAMNYINNCLEEGWLKKDSINWEDYK